MSDQHSGVEDEVERALRLGLATASQIADRFARARRDLARHAQHRDQQEARQLEARYRAEGASATARLAVVDRTEWWDRATPAEVTSMWELAAQWQDEQPRAATAAETIAWRVRDRYDIDVRALGVDADIVHAALAHFEYEQRDRAGRWQDRDDTATAVTAVQQIEQRDVARGEPTVEVRQEASAHTQVSPYGSLAAPVAALSEPDAAPSYDSAERREHAADQLRKATIVEETIAVAMRADVAHARPAAEAAMTRATASRCAGTSVPTRGAQRPDRGR
jgi:colicin import membrane protein